ncbi:prokineticin-2 isoform X1 [Moschus berezovskii]|uniref:prokineticin-2 isoform X1 n=1 Tax=Moschus berezovskii TaxID=68408 RepID=UPI002444FCF5|nr:prokineticin-2 isoform X1 [Moschus berezovskii]
MASTYAAKYRRKKSPTSILFLKTDTSFLDFQHLILNEEMTHSLFWRIRSNKLHIVHEYVVLFIFQACDRDPQCGGGMCCAVSIWVKSIRICTPMGKVGDSCHPMTRKNHFGNGRQERRKRKRRRKKKVPFFGRRMHHTCPCLPGLACSRTSFNRYTCLARK